MNKIKTFIQNLKDDGNFYNASAIASCIGAFFLIVGMSLYCKFVGYNPVVVAIVFALVAVCVTIAIYCIIRDARETKAYISEVLPASMINYVAEFHDTFMEFENHKVAETYFRNEIARCKKAMHNNGSQTVLYQMEEAKRILRNLRKTR